jgi:hypothetical protein
LSSPSRTAAWRAASCRRRTRCCTPPPSREPALATRAARCVGQREAIWLRRPIAGSGETEEPLSPRPAWLYREEEEEEEEGESRRQGPARARLLSLCLDGVVDLVGGVVVANWE